jgi:serine/threonine-protein kinase
LEADSAPRGRFLPGTMLAGRYRIVGLVGGGGMGEVYRADDLKLGQPVALKFLPRRFADDPARLEYFHNEVRLARQVSHPNVCRVHDIGEVEGQHFLSMEYVDGEDLATLIRRIGRLAVDKGIEIARQLCAGLAAAHDRGVLHRDLKPSNVMLDGRGQVRITDFGLARRSEEKEGDREQAGTPGYMAPEQLAGGEATVRSDLYALGLVLYELFTGRPAFQAHPQAGTRPAEVARSREGSSVVTPSSIVEEIDPAVEEVILRCLEKDPRERPPSALAVAAGLPGGDPLAAALAAGQTPSPELVAAAGKAGGLRLAVGAACLAGLLLGLGVVALLSDQATVVGRVRREMKKPEALEETAHEIIKSLGYGQWERGDSEYGFDYDEDYLQHVDQDRSATRWDNLDTGHPAAMYFWYRQSPQDLCPTERFASAVTLRDPPPVASCMISVRLDLQGRLLGLHTVPLPVEDSGAEAEAQAPEWPELFVQADLQQQGLRATDHLEWSPALYADRWSAWEGKLAEGEIRVEAASYRGKPVYFELLWPEWTSPERAQPFFRRAAGSAQKSQAGRTMNDALALIIFVAAALLARRNLHLGRSDRKGAVKVALCVFCLGMLAWLFGASHVVHFSRELSLFYPTFIWNVYAATWFFLVYLALEPYVRRLWPETLISWNRLLAGRLRDRLLGRDLLVGALVGTAWAILYPLSVLAAAWLGAPAGLRRTMAPSTLLEGQHLAAHALYEAQYALVVGLSSLLTLLLLRFLLRNQWLAGALFVVIWAAVVGLGSHSYVYWLTASIFWGSVVFVLTRHGLVTYLAALVCFLLLRSFPITADYQAWYWGKSLFALAIVAGIGAYAFYICSAARPRLAVTRANAEPY